MFDAEFQIQSACISSKSEYLALGGTDGLIEVWNFQSMELDTIRLPY